MINLCSKAIQPIWRGIVSMRQSIVKMRQQVRAIHKFLLCTNASNELYN